jgi:hypothetical protein
MIGDVVQLIFWPGPGFDAMPSEYTNYSWSDATSGKNI